MCSGGEASWVGLRNDPRCTLVLSPDCKACAGFPLPLLFIYLFNNRCLIKTFVDLFVIWKYKNGHIFRNLQNYKSNVILQGSSLRSQQRKPENSGSHQSCKLKLKKEIIFFFLLREFKIHLLTCLLQWLEIYILFTPFPSPPYHCKWLLLLDAVRLLLVCGLTLQPAACRGCFLSYSRV